MIKMIAVDMDGTFLDDEKKYNKPRFLALYKQLKKENIQFVVASGNQYYQLISFFPEIFNEISFVAENGAYVVQGENPLFCGKMSKRDVAKILSILSDIPYLSFVVCGKGNAYIHSASAPNFIQLMSKHYYRLQIIDDFSNIEDTIFKFSLNLQDKRIPELMTFLGHSLDGIINPVSSGYGFVDLIIPGIHKAHGLSLLQKKWQINHNEVVAIGDSGNDYEMVAQAGFGFSMSNAQDEILKVAKYRTEDNNNEGVLNVIEKVLCRSFPFD
ncbi:Cof-type HAD-IIB family hydrolase [Pantoea sp. B65]|uniref:Cof-type HAD-IIB family hydrolase n=1 Tax=Pantoea sp. B65 TaxID=2813359 RepID=UPI0039B3892D